MIVKMLQKKSVQGFTLVELLIVITIIGVLALVVFANFSGARERARDSKRKNDLNQLKNALQMYYNDNQIFPVASNGKMLACGDGEDVCNWGSSEMTSGITVYMKQVPADPLSSNSYTYSQTSEGDNFTITTILENEADTAGAESRGRCNTTSGPEIENVFVVCAD